MVRVQEPTFTTRMQNIREQRGQASGMHDSANSRHNQDPRMAEKPSKEIIQLDQKENIELETG